MIDEKTKQKVEPAMFEKNKGHRDVFISYSRKDYVDENDNVIPDNVVSKIRKALTDAGITYWFDEEGIYSGDKFTEKIVSSIEASKVFLFISTINASKSPWTSKEIACADEFGKYIIPVRIDKTPYNKKIMFRIADLSYVDYGKNPEKGLQEIITSINAYLVELKELEREKKYKEKQRQEELELQRKKQEEEIIQQEKIAKIESKLITYESQRLDCKKAVLQKEQELKLAQVDLDEIENQIKTLRIKLQKLTENRRIKEEKKDIGTEEKGTLIKENQQLPEEMEVERTFTINNVSFKMIKVEGKGSPFYIGETLVTQELWEILMKNNPSNFKGNKHPVECVTWYDCQDFIKKLNAYTNNSFRLPKEDEWVYASKGGNKSRGYLYSGSNTIEDVAWYEKNSYNCGINNPNYGTHDVKNKKPNELGIYDMSGNVWEWCEDMYESNETRRIIMGGSWYDNANSCRVDSRSIIFPDKGFNLIGFRLALVCQ